VSADPGPLSPRHWLRHRQVRPGERWIYSAGFNVRPDLAATERVDTELADIRRILDAGGRLAILSHQGGSAGDGAALELDFVARYLSTRLGRPVGYVPENASWSAVRRARELRAGEAVLFGNTRKHRGEQRDDPELARRFAQLGDVVAVGGFSKAHRSHASNVGLLRHLPGYLADSVLTQLALLAPWAVPDDRCSMAVLGGLKPEKTVVGLDVLSGRYDVVVPGGAVLNTVLRALGHDIGASAVGDAPEKCLRVAKAVLARRNRAEIHIPDEVVVTRAPGERAVVRVADGVPAGWSIADFVPNQWLRERFAELAGGRALIAGTPSRYLDGFRSTADELLRVFAAADVDALLLGGDTVAELPWPGPTSTGGGAALHYLAHGTCPVIEAVRAAPARGCSR
jgi:phosphoglycerate kinase